MAIDLHWELAALFYEQDTVHLPGIGGFVLRDAPAEVDPVQGKVEAPSRQVVFDPNLVIDDGLLTRRLREVHQLSAAEAERRIAAFSTTIKATLDQGELVAFPGIGRLYRNYNGELQFLADGRNFSTETFGLSPVELQAVTRARGSAAATAVPAGKSAYASKSAPPAPGGSPPVLIWVRKYLYYILGATALIFIVGMLLLSRNGPAEPSLEAPTRIPRGRLNVPPSAVPPATAGTEEEETIQDDLPAAETPSREPALEPPSTPNRYGIIAVGLFGNETNVQKMVARIERAGFEPFTAREGNLTRVGVQVRYETESELITALRGVQSRIVDGAFILEKEGQRQAPR